SRAGGSITAIPTSKSSRSSSAGRPEKDCTSADLSKEFETPDDVETNDGYAHALGGYRGARHVVDTGRLYASRGLALILAGGPAGTRGPGARPRSGVRGALREIPRGRPREGRAPRARETARRPPPAATRGGRTGH